MRLQNVEIIPIRSDFQVIVSPSLLQPPDKIVREIDAIWQAASEQSDSKLFDGKILCALEISSKALVCSIIPYRFFYAQRQSNMIRNALQIKVVAVSGLIFHHGLLYFGRRSLSITQYPNFIELVPSGSIDADSVVTNGKADFCKQLENELIEELSVKKKAVSSIEPLLLAFDRQENTWDICCRIILKADATKSIDKNFESQEYQEIICVHLTELVNFLKANAKCLLPTTQVILQQVFPELNSPEV